MHLNPLHVYRELVDRGFFRGSSRRPFIEEAVRRVYKAIDNGRGVLLIAPPGIGKTAVAISVAIAVGLGYEGVLRVIHVLPLRSIIDDVHARFREGLEKLGVDADLNLVAKQYSMAHGTPYFYAPYVATTVDTYMFNLVKLPVKELWKLSYERHLYGHYELARASVYTALNFLDEAHLVLEGCREGVLSLAAVLKHFNRTLTPFVIATATLPPPIVNALRRSLSMLEVVSYEASGADDFYNVEVGKVFKPVPTPRGALGVSEVRDLAEVVELLTSSPGRRALVVNTVTDAVKAYEAVGRKALLLHSRFTPEDRGLKVRELSSCSTVITTQVIEAGIDTSFDTVISELAPISNIVQRFGRLARWGDAEEGYWMVFYGEGRVKGSGVYDEDLAERSLKVLSKYAKKAINWHLPRAPGAVGYEDLIEAAWRGIKASKFMGVNPSVFSALESPLVSSKDVRELLEIMGSFVRGDALCTIYVCNVPSDYQDFRESLARCGIPISCTDALRYALKARDIGYDVAYLKLADGFKVREEVFKPELARVREEVVKGTILAISIPRSLYEGGVSGVGLLQP